VALCTYNGARYISAQLESLLAQTQLPAQIVVSDDGSADSTRTKAAEVLSRTAVAVLWQEHRPALGVTENFESAVRAADADLIALCDQDDVWHPKKLALLTRVFESDPSALFVFTDASLIDGNGGDLGRGLFESLGVSESELSMIEAGNALPVFLRRNIATGATVVFRRELLQLALPFPPSWVHDEWLATVAALHGGVRVLREKTIDYRQHGDNQIGVSERTLTYKLRRMLAPRRSRNSELARKFSDLEARFARSNLSREHLALLYHKARFERARAGMPRHRLLRVPSVVVLAAQGCYSQFASQGMLDIFRDLLQPA
jgi:glycosyltransferase involved in cell wall biosynthesis